MFHIQFMHNTFMHDIVSMTAVANDFGVRLILIMSPMHTKARPSMCTWIRVANDFGVARTLMFVCQMQQSGPYCLVIVTHVQMRAPSVSARIIQTV